MPPRRNQARRSDPAPAPAPADPSDLLEQQRRQILAALVAEVQELKPDPSYTYEYKKFKKYVDEHPGLSATNDNPPKYITRQNVDMWFMQVVSQRKGVKNTINRALWAIEWYSDNKEHIVDKFNVRSSTVDIALRVQYKMQQARSSAKPGTDPHKGLKDRLCQPDRSRIFAYILNHRNDWGPAGVNFSLGFSGAVRGDSNRKFCLIDLRTSTGFGPSENPPLNRATGIILRKGPLHKDSFALDEQVLLWRNMNYHMCPVFYLSAHVIYLLNYTHSGIHFFRYDKKKPADWWLLPLIEWETYSHTKTPTVQIYRGAGVECSKITHHRTAAIQDAGFRSLAPWQINTLTNHMQDKQHKSYQSVVEYTVSKFVYDIIVILAISF